MAGVIPSFLTGANAVIRIGDAKIAYCQNLSFTRAVRHEPVIGVGSYSTHAIEPVDYEANGSLNIMRYSSAIVYGKTNPVIASRKTLGILPYNMTESVEDPTRDGNSMLSTVTFNPQLMLLSYTFDIDVYERVGNSTGPNYVTNEGRRLFTMHDCRLVSYSYNFVPGELLMESVDFVARYISDALAAQA